MILSPTLRALTGATFAATLVLSGCNSDGSDSAGSELSGSFTYDGTGAEVLGYYVAEVTASTGIYNTVFEASALPGNQSTRSGKQAPVGFSQTVQLYKQNGDLVLDTSMGNGNVTLTPNATTKTYDGTLTYSGYDGLENTQVTEQWIVSFSGSTVKFTISGSTDETTPETGTVTMTLRPISPVGGALDTMFYGRNTSSTLAGLTGVTSELELWDWGPGTYGYWTPEASTDDWNDYFYFDGMYRSGNALKAGGWQDSSDYSTDSPDLFATITVNLDATGRPTTVVSTIYDYDNFDDDGNQDTEPASFTTTSSGYKTDDQLQSLYQRTPDFDLTVDTMDTTGGILEDFFGIVGHTNASMVDTYGDYVSVDGNRFYGGYVSGTQQKIEAWMGRYYDYYNDYPDYDIDGDAATRDRLIWTFTYDNTTLPATATGGSLVLKQYADDGTLSHQESMTFTLDNPGPSVPTSGYYIYQGLASNFTSVHINGSNVENWAVTNGSLPGGLTLDAATGVISGTPNTGWYNFQVTGTAANGKTAQSSSIYFHSW